jgi:hypothetical protein
LSLRPSLCGGDSWNNIIKRVLNDSDASDLRGPGEVSQLPRIKHLPFGTFLLVDVELTDI